MYISTIYVRDLDTDMGQYEAWKNRLIELTTAFHHLDLFLPNPNSPHVYHPKMKSFATLALLTFVTLAVATPTTVELRTPGSPAAVRYTTADCPEAPTPEVAETVPDGSSSLNKSQTLYS